MRSSGASVLLTAVLIGLTGWHSGVLSGLKDVHPLLLTAGALGACLVFAIAWLLPQVGARAMFITLIAGQVLGGMILSHFGWLGSPVQRISLTNLLGAAVMICGVVLATYVRADASRPSVKKVKLGKSNLEVSALAMGSDLIGSKIDRDTAFKLFDFYRKMAARSLTRQTCMRAGCRAAWVGRARPPLAPG